jgi:hypothetical protein
MLLPFLLLPGVTNLRQLWLLAAGHAQVNACVRIRRQRALQRINYRLDASIGLLCVEEYNGLASWKSSVITGTITQLR